MRSCGECSACCYTLAVEELEKDSRTPCKHQCASGGCSIYDEKPESCTRFVCSWLEGVVEESYRPDVTNVVVWSMHESRYEYGFKTLYVMESADRACETEVGKALLRSLLQDGWVLIVRSYVTRPIVQWHVNLAVPGIGAYVERLIDQGKAVVSVNIQILDRVTT